MRGGGGGNLEERSGGGCPSLNEALSPSCYRDEAFCVDPGERVPTGDSTFMINGSVTTTYKECEDPKECEAGDMSTKFGKFTKPEVKATFKDTQTTLYGYNR
jgi:hypothetical protein